MKILVSLFVFVLSQTTFASAPALAVILELKITSVSVAGYVEELKIYNSGVVEYVENNVTIKIAELSEERVKKIIAEIDTISNNQLTVSPLVPCAPDAPTFEYAVTNTVGNKIAIGTLNALNCERENLISGQSYSYISLLNGLLSIARF